MQNEDLADLIARADRGEITLSGGPGSEVVKDLTGLVFGQLTVVRRLPNLPYGTRWLCRCTCGNEVAVYRGNIRSSRSCGCAKNRKGKESPHWKGFGDLPGRHWAVIESNAHRKGHEFYITIEEGWDLYISQNRKCALTGWAIKFSTYPPEETTASLDRIDSNIGYVTGNVQWLHKDVNKSKNVYSQDYFIQMCKAVTDQEKERT